MFLNFEFMGLMNPFVSFGFIPWHNEVCVNLLGVAIRLKN